MEKFFEIRAIDLIILFFVFLLVVGIHNIHKKVDYMMKQNIELNEKVDSLTKEVYLMNVDIYD